MPDSNQKILFDRFEIIDTLKKDQHTSVYLANHIYLGKKIILKTLSADELSDKISLDRFKREAKIIAQLDHKNIIKVLDFGTSGNLFYISFEYFEGRNLREIIRDSSLSDEDRNNLCVQLFNALNAAHQNGIIHRDIKPENILVNPGLELKIADFGLALNRDENLLTHKSSIVGTPGYMSPEQIRGEELTPQTDLFSSGIVIYELFSGANPFIGKDVGETINNILNFRLEKDLKLLSSLPENIRLLLDNLLRKNLSKRIKTASEALSFFDTGLKVSQATTEKSEKKKSKKKLYFYTGLITLMLIAGYFLGTNLFKKDEINAVEDTRLKEAVIFKDSLVNDSADVAGEPAVTIKEEEPAPAEDTPEIEKQFTYGRLFVEVSPWADVFIDNRKIGTTPLRNEISLLTGEYELKLVHEDFPVYIEKIKIEPDTLISVRIDFNEKVGFLYCNVYPYGDIYINGEYVNTTPLRKPISLMPGEYNLRVSNKNYDRDIEKVITIKVKETLTLSYNFENMH